MVTNTEENYLIAIFKIAEKEQNSASTNSISKMMKTSAASVTDMIKRLSDKELIHYQRYRGVSLTTAGNKIATDLIRKHRLWEVFLSRKLNFNWDQVHDIAEQLEHIKSKELIDRLDEYLGYPKFDPHGDPIPNANGKFTLRAQMTLPQLNKGQKAVLIGVKIHDVPFLQYLTEIQFKLGTKIQILDINSYDESVKLIRDGIEEIHLSEKVAKNLFFKTF